MTTIVNLYGGPGVGKSTCATGVFSKLKQEGVLCEYVSEYAKDIVWEGTTALLDNQIHIFSEQLRRQWRLLGKVDYVITDSPLLLSPVYFAHWEQKDPERFSYTFAEKTKDFFLSAFREFNNHNFYIQRLKKYVQDGRIQTEDEAIQVDEAILKYLTDTYTFYYLTDSQRAIGDITRFILEEVSKKKWA